MSAFDPAPTNGPGLFASGLATRTLINVLTQTIKVHTFMGRPPGRMQGETFQVRFSVDFLKSLDKWRAKEADKPSRAEAIRRLVQLGLSTAPTRPAVRRSSQAGPKASALAGKQIDRLADLSATVEQRASRKRRLLKGPKEFRGFRSDHSTKGK